MSKLKYFDVKNVTEKNAELYIYGDIVGDEWNKWCDTDTCPKDIIDALKETEGKTIDIYINSGGGSVFAGLAIYNMLCRKKEKKTCHIDGLAASIASVIAMAGDEIIMPSNSFLMIHRPSSYMTGNAEDFRKEADNLDIVQLGIENVYKNKINDNITLEEIRQMMINETWLNANESKKYFNVQIVAENKAIAKIDLKTMGQYKNVPEQILFENKNKKDNVKNKLQVELKLLNM